MIFNKTKDIIKLLGNISIFAGLDKKDYKKILPLLVPIKYPPDSEIITQDDDGDSMYIIKNGSVRVLRSEKNAEVVLVGNLEPGEFFGELSLIDNLPRSATVISNDESEIFRLSRHDLDKLMDENEHIALLFYKNCLKESFARFRNVVSNFTFSQKELKEKMSEMIEIQVDLVGAQELQKYFTGIEGPENRRLPGGLSYSYIYRPCRSVGGDFLNVLDLGGGKTGFIMADVEGKGIQASLATGVLKSCVSMIYKQMGEKPGKILKYINGHFNKIIADLYATCCYAVYDGNTATLSLASAGKIYPLYFRNRKKGFADVRCAGSALGVDEGPKYDVCRIRMEAGDRVLFYTGGAVNQEKISGKNYSLHRLSDKFLDLISAGSDDIPEDLYRDIVRFSGKESADDDITFLLLSKS
jgi:serine phosphatase RsbU (regulator of sigma subunit)